MATRGWEHVTADQVARAVPKPRKYRNVRVEIDGEMFDSKAEANYYLLLRDREQRGEIRDVARQMAFPLKTARKRPNGRVLLVEVCRYVADFVYREGDVWHVVDVKRQATRTREYLLKRKWLELQDEIVIEEVHG